MPISLMTITSGYVFENVVAPLLQKYLYSTLPVPSPKVQGLWHLIQILVTYQITGDLYTGI